ncbi:hypothetical protein C8R43DRAFT_987894 [Mycena crocata]|nr:hypothetical protein C8R43DRAFT_987894 [Mycena crocata]
MVSPPDYRPNINDSKFHCPLCTWSMKLVLCNKGRNKNRYFLACHNKNHPDAAIMWHFFPRGQSPTPVAQQQVILCPPPKPRPAVRAPTMCAIIVCKGIRPVNKLCEQQMCKRHCLARGGCRCHQPEAKVALPALSASNIKLLNELLRNALPPTIRTSTPVSPLDKISALLSPSPTLSQEEEDYEYALRLSREPGSPPYKPSYAHASTSMPVASFLKLHRLQSPLTIPRNIISDFDPAQIHAAIAEYNAFILLCWWHVLHAWQQHFHIPQEPELWELLKSWLRITDRAKFDQRWAKIKQTARSVKFIQYLEKYWMPEHIVRMWSAVYRKDRNIFEACDTNMLIEAWHHVLKGKFLHGKRNRRLDHLLHVLFAEVIPYYKLKQLRQDLGFEGIDIEVKERKNVIKRAESYVKEDIEHLEEGTYLVRSQSEPSRAYEVDLETYTCTCAHFPFISLCKHICAVQVLFKEACDKRPLFAPSADSPQIPAHDPHDNDAVQDDLPNGDNHPAAFEVVKPPKTHPLIFVAEKIERLGARLRRTRKDESAFPSLAAFKTLLDAMLDDTENGNILPSSQHIPPNSNEWRQTKASMVMPPVKTRPKRAGDPSYGAGASSGGKAKKSKPNPKELPATTPSLPTSTPSVQAPSQAPPTPLQYIPNPPLYYPMYPQAGPVPNYPYPYMYAYPPSQVKM